MLRKVKLRKSESGVSEVVANILILAITVTLFTGVIYWVWGMPAPTGKPTTNFEGTVRGTTFILKHAGGDIIWDKDTTMILNVTWYGATASQSKQKIVWIHDDIYKNFTVGDDWATGEVWSYDLTAVDSSITPTNILRVSITMSSKELNRMIWEGTFLPVGKHAPIILAVGMMVYDETREDWFASKYVFTGQKFKLFATVVDPDDDLDRVWVGGKGWADLRYTPETLTYNFYTDQFETSVKTAPSPPNDKKTNYTVTFYAVDSIGQNAEHVRYTFVILPRTIGDVNVGQLTNLTTVMIRPGYSVREYFSVEVEFSDLQPTAGERIFITAFIRNIGDVGAESATVTFYDATDDRTNPTFIGNRTVSVPAKGRLPVLMPWTPQSVGTRLIWINVTDIKPFDATEKSKFGGYEFTNNASATIEVYIYYDDLESGIGKWRHYATVLRMNAEGALEFDNRSTDIEIVYQQDRNPPPDGTDSIPFNVTDFDSHTKPHSYYAFEPASFPPTRVPVDVTLTIDTSGSMNWDSPSRITYAKQAAIHFVDIMDPSTDRISVWDFGARQYSGYYYKTYCDIAFSQDFNAVKNAINSLWAYGWTPGWDGTAITSQYTREIGSPGATTATTGTDFPPHPVPCRGASRAMNLVRAVIILTDGAFNYNYYYSKSTCLNEVTISYQTYGVMHFTIGIGSSINEQDLRDIANAGGGQYFHVSQASQLDPVFQQIAQIIIQEAYNQTALPDYYQPCSVPDDDNKPYATYTYTDSPNAYISPWQSYQSITRQITVPSSENLVITQIRVYVRIDHTYVWDLRVSIRHPDGTLVYLHNKLDGSQNDIHGWYVADYFIPDSGYNNYGSSGDLRVYNNKQSQGTWTFRLEDTAYYDGGYLREWRLEVTGNVPGGGGGGGAGGGGAGGVAPNQPAWMPPGNKSLVSQAFTIGRLWKSPTNPGDDIISAKLTFYHKYNLVIGSNGGVVMIGVHTGSTATTSIKYYYVVPTPPYTGNLNLDFNYYDDDGKLMRFAYNGISANGRYEWEYAEVNITDFLGGGKYNPSNNPIRVKFQYYYCTGGDNGSWFIDDIEVQITRLDRYDDTMYSAPINCKDKWVLKNYSYGTTVPNYEEVHSASSYFDESIGKWKYYGHAWYHSFGGSRATEQQRSVDNSLITTIDLVDVKDAYLKAYIRFNINPKDGAPPHCLRIEVSDDAGATWKAICMGIRSGWGFSGNDPDGWHLDLSDYIIDGKSLAGIHETGDITSVAWVPTTSLTRVQCDLSQWAGRVILLKFRVIINNVPNFPVYQPTYADPPTEAYEWGVSIDDIRVEGNVTGVTSIPQEPVATTPPQPTDDIKCNDDDYGSESDKGVSDNKCEDDIVTKATNSDGRHTLAIYAERFLLLSNREQYA